MERVGGIGCRYYKFNSKVCDKRLDVLLVVDISNPHLSTLPRVTFHQALVNAEEGSAIELPCVAQGNPPPSYRWMKYKTGNLSAIHENGRVWLLQGVLVIRRVVQKDAGRYQCTVRNSIGETRVESALVVTALLQVAVLPAHQVSNTGEEATFTCNVTGYPVHTLAWTKDQRPVVASQRVRFPSRDVLRIMSLRREDRGMYQCFAYNDRDGAQGTAQLKISDVPPSIVSAFLERTLQPGGGVFLKCIVVGSPLPRITWYLDSSAIGQTGRISMGDYITDDARLVSFFNISEVLVEDGGEYGCEAGNDGGRHRTLLA
ncbi:down syndrome cell adhesion molecule homolog [Caerostris extrusa]|uniref:Down syndrome cell adhesion molecule homolog n=1 Tax=Caerostris extrusa TaxID=172846 RepID=A0AAV4XR50_CAEEX|nr:down syndrome cell adhesion molecule homolog [Caerostris extrusa]